MVNWKRPVLFLSWRFLRRHRHRCRQEGLRRLPRHRLLFFSVRRTELSSSLRSAVAPKMVFASISFSLAVTAEFCTGLVLEASRLSSTSVSLKIIFTFPVLSDSVFHRSPSHFSPYRHHRNLPNWQPVPSWKDWYRQTVWSPIFPEKPHR